MMDFGGRPVLGAIAGLFLGLFLALVLQQWGIRPLDNLSVLGLPLAGVVLGLVLARWAPLGRDRDAAPPGEPQAQGGEPQAQVGEPQAPGGEPQAPGGEPQA